MYIRPHVMYPSFLSDFNEDLNFLNKFSKNIQISNFMKIRPVGAKLFQWTDRHTNGQTDNTLTISCSQDL